MKLIELFDKFWLPPSTDNYFKIHFHASFLDVINKQGNVVGLIKPNINCMEFGLKEFEGDSEEDCWNNIDKFLYTFLVDGSYQIELANNPRDFDCENDKYGICMRFSPNTLLCLYLKDPRFDKTTNKWYIKCSPICYDINKVKIYRKNYHE